MAEWLKAADCKSVEVSQRRFESCSLQKFILQEFYQKSKNSRHSVGW